MTSWSYRPKHRQTLKNNLHSSKQTNPSDIPPFQEIYINFCLVNFSEHNDMSGLLEGRCFTPPPVAMGHDFRIASGDGER